MPPSSNQAFKAIADPTRREILRLLRRGEMTAGDLAEAAANLFSHLRALDALGASSIAIVPIPAEGLGEAINDRLSRAAAPRPVKAP